MKITTIYWMKTHSVPLGESITQITNSLCWILAHSQSSGNLTEQQWYLYKLFLPACCFVVSSRVIWFRMLKRQQLNKEQKTLFWIVPSLSLFHSSSLSPIQASHWCLLFMHFLPLRWTKASLLLRYHHGRSFCIWLRVHLRGSSLKYI